MKCPECKIPMRWKEGLLTEAGGKDIAVGRFYCTECNLWCKPIESRAIKRGRKLAKDLVNVHCLDKKITKYSCAEQIGIFREMQHCKTCGLPNYSRTELSDFCMCEDCNCLYCENKIPTKQDPEFIAVQEKAIIKMLKNTV